MKKNNLKIEFKRKYLRMLLVVSTFLSVPFSVFAQVPVQGVVLDTTGSPIEGVSVFAKVSSTTSITDQNGKYTISIKNLQDTLIFRIIGREAQQIPVRGRTEINVTMKSNTNLGNVVVIGFGKQKRSDMVGAVTSINPSELKIPSSNLTAALAGRIPGLIAFQRTGEPGRNNAKFFIRGVTSFGYSSNPLILIDGVEATATDLARLQVDDIKNFSILKDATATAIYGSKGANGVILITTKEGNAGKTKIFFRVENSVSEPTTTPKLADPITYMRDFNEAILTRNPSETLPFSLGKIDKTERRVDPVLYPEVNWQRALFKRYTMNQRAYLNVSGGGKIARFFVSGSFNQDNGILKVPKLNNFNNNINLKSYSLRTNANMRLFKNTKLSVKLSGSFDDYKGPLNGGVSVYRNMMRTSPVRFLPYYNPGEKYSYLKHVMFGNYKVGSEFYINPYAEMVRGYKNYSRSRMRAQFQIRQDLSFITKGLNFRIMGNTTRNSFFSVRRAYTPFYYMPIGHDLKDPSQYDYAALNEDQGTDYLNYDGSDKNVSSLFYMEAALNYKRTFHKKNDIGGLLVYTLRSKLQGTAGSLQQSLPFRNLGLAGRFTYSYDSRYFLQFNFGYNGSERFSKNNRFGFFPSAGIAWTVSNETFWKHIKPTFSKLRLRLTYGLVGNDRIGPPSSRFYYISEINENSTQRSATFGRVFDNYNSGISVARYANPNITWEVAHKLNLGIEVGILNSLKLNVDLYRQKRTKIFITRSHIPTFTGFEAPIASNAGRAVGNGIDLSLNYNKSFPNEMWLKIMGNFTYAFSKYLAYSEPNYAKENAPWLSRIGEPINQRWGLIAERLFVDSAEINHSPEQEFGVVMAGDIKYKDINGDGKVNLLDQVPIGYPTTPEINYGFGFSFGYKNWDISAFFEGLARESFWIDQAATGPFIDYDYPGEGAPEIHLNQLLEVYAKSHWSEDNQNLYAIWPRLSTYIVPNNNQSNTWFMRSGSFMRLKQLEIGYTLPKHLTKRWKINNLRFYLNGSNLFLWSKFKLWDVEMAGNGLDYPIQRVFNIGIQLNL